MMGTEASSLPTWWEKLDAGTVMTDAASCLGGNKSETRIETYALVFSALTHMRRVSRANKGENEEQGENTKVIVKTERVKSGSSSNKSVNIILNVMCLTQE